MDNSINDVVQYLSQPKKSLTIFCGAGISINSGLPPAIGLLDKILIQLNIDLADKDLLIRPDWTLAIPFELFFETFLDNNDDHSVLDLFKAGEPSTTHLFL